MKKLHLAISTHDIASTVEDDSARLGVKPCAYIAGEYALWRTECLNLSVRADASRKAGELRHLGWEDSSEGEFSEDVDVNGIVWERFSARQQAEEINQLWPVANYQPRD